MTVGHAVLPFAVAAVGSQLVAVCACPPVFVQVIFEVAVTLSVGDPVEDLNPQSGGEIFWHTPFVSQIVIGVAP